jgi:hypothetical protein
VARRQVRYTEAIASGTRFPCAVLLPEVGRIVPSGIGLVKETKLCNQGGAASDSLAIEMT